MTSPTKTSPTKTSPTKTSPTKSSPTATDPTATDPTVAGSTGIGPFMPGPSTPASRASDKTQTETKTNTNIETASKYLMGRGLGQAWRSLRDDLAAARFRLWVNNLGGHAAMPRVLRYLIYRGAGLDIRTANIYPGCIFVARHIAIGANTFVNRGCLFEGAGPLTIGPDCQIAMEAMFLTSTHPWTADGAFARRPENRSTTVGRRCWIGARAMILPGVTVGDGCVVAAGSVVTHDCEPGHLYAGVPARKIRRLTACTTEPELSR